MLIDIVTQGTTDYSCMLRVVDSTDGTPETAVAYNTAGVDLWYRRPDAAHTSITEATQTEAGAHSDGGFVHISDGYCRLDLPDAAVAAGADYVDVGGTFTDMIVIGGRIKLIPAIRGLAGTAVPNVVAGAAGGLATDTDANGRVRIVDGTAAGELDTVSGGVILADSASHGGSATVFTFDRLTGTSTSGSCMSLTGQGAGAGLELTGGGSAGNGLKSSAGGGIASGIYSIGTSIGNGCHFVGGSGGGGLRCDASGSAAGIYATGGASDGPGVRFEGDGNGHGMMLYEAGTGKSLADAGGGYVGMDVLAISEDETAAVNAESAFDGNGYNVGNGSIVAASVTGNVGGSVNSLNTQAKADVNAELKDVLDTDTYTERAIAAGPPAANAPLSDKIVWLAMLARNKLTSDGSTQTLFDDAGTGTVSTSSISDAAGTTTRGEWS